MAVFLVLLLLMSLLPLSAFAEEAPAAELVSEEMAEEIPATDPTPTPEPTPPPTESPEESPAPELTEPTEEEISAEETPSPEPEEVNSPSMEEVQAALDALPELNAVMDMSPDERMAAYEQFSAACDLFYLLSMEDQERIDMSRMIELSAFFASPEMAATQYYQETWDTNDLTSYTKGGWYDANGYYRTWALGLINNHWIYDTSEGHAAYCIRPDQGETNYYYYYTSGTGTSAWDSQITSAQRDLIRLALLYGYPNCVNCPGHVHNASYCQSATQMLIFEAITKCLSSTAPYRHSDTVFSDALPYSSARNGWYNIYWDMLNRIQNDGWLPSWMRSSQSAANSAPIELTYNKSTGLYEGSFVNSAAKNTNAQSYGFTLDEFSYNSPAGITITRDTSQGDSTVSQRLIITATPEAMANETVQFSVTTPYLVHSSSSSSYPATVYIYARYSESWGAWYQTMIQPAYVQSGKVYGYMTLHGEPPTGFLELAKTSDDGTVGGIQFTVTNNETGASQTATTDSSGKFNLELDPGVYTVTETVPVTHVSSKSSQTVTIDAGETTTVSFTNTLKRFRLSVTKTDEDKGHAQGDGSLAGAVYGLYRGSELVDTYTTDTSGSFTTAYYPCGDNWSLREITPSKGYLLDSVSHGVSAAASGFQSAQNTVPLAVTECPIMGQITVTKTASNSVDGIYQPEDGAVFEVYLQSAGSYDKAAESERDVITIGNDGKATTKSLPYGTYIVRQRSGWEGYKLDKSLHEISITENSKVYTVASVNEIYVGSLTVLKQDKYEQTPLEGAVYQLINKDGTVRAEGTTGKDGTLTFNKIPYGTYTYKEIKAPVGYLLDETVYDFALTEDGQTSYHTRDNCRKPGSLSVLKTDSDGTPLAGAEYLLEYSADRGKSWQPVFHRDGENITEGGSYAEARLVTGKDGLVTFDGLRADGHILYRLTETKAPEGYNLMPKSIYTDTLYIGSGDEAVFDISLTVRDGIITGLPMTGGSSLSLWPAALLLLLAAVILYTAKRKPSSA